MHFFLQLWRCCCCCFRITWLLAVSLVSTADCARILVFLCQVARSHHIVLHPIIRALAERGHEVDYYTHAPLPNAPKNLNQIQFPLSIENAMQVMEKIDLKEFVNMPITRANLFHRQMKLLGNESTNACHEYSAVKELLASDKKYDLVIGEFFFAQEEYTVLLHTFKAPGVAVSTVPDVSWLNEMSGLPDNPAYMGHFTVDTTQLDHFLSRLRNFCNNLAMKATDYFFLMTYYQWLADEWLVYEGWQSRPSILQLSSNMSLILTNSHHSLGFPYPRSPLVKEVLGTNVDQAPPPLPKDLQEYMDSAEHGIVYFSMGSIVSVKHLKAVGAFDALAKSLSGLKQKVLWKWTAWNDEAMPSIPNIKMAKWMPQQSILAHNKTKLFITHGGLGSLSEAVHHGVPIIGVPVFGDQFRNLKILSSTGFGVELVFDNLTDQSVSWAVNEVLNNPRYSIEASRRSKLFRDRPMKPVDEAVYWIEYVIKHGQVLQPASLKLSFYQLYLLDVIGCILAAICLSIFSVRKLAKLAVSFLRKKAPKKNLSKKTE
ncbi:unnamed protein product [Nesidiocoris tenuis]|uniref:Uncharacterized protein n=1 Tax=Nesidiocoris tenuis TaxID=355587 RepID=A0A6H5FWU0_9HEMI|nr:unnamed protein product [Nesidiocoris tenuis]